MNRRDNVRLQLVAALAACLFFACTPFDKVSPDGGGDGAAGGVVGDAGARVGGAGAGGTAGTGAPGAAGAAGTSSAGGVTGSAGVDASADVRVDTATETGGGGSDLKMTGAGCSKASDCATNLCFDGVCCATNCSQTCMSCANAKTGAAEGKCAPVKGGIAHANDCTATAATTCGHDGTCDGAGSCRNHAASTVCGGESCLVGTSSYTPESKCDGYGTCVPASQPCGKYKCTADGVRCRVSCAADTDCTTAAFCQTAFCLDKLAPGSLCSRSEQCTSGLCGGRCCNPGVPCKCTQPSPSNLFANPGFDKDLLSWGLDEPVDFASWTTTDAENCPFSGSIKSTTNSGYPNQTVAVKGGTTYNFGAMVSAFEVGATFLCDLEVTGVNPEDAASQTVLTSLNRIGSWQAIVGSITTPPFAKLLNVTCEVAGTRVDQLFLTEAPGKY